MSAALRALDGAPLAHLAAHGHHDQENFLFSRLDLADGPLMAYDIQQLAAAPRHVVLSSCDVGRTVVRPGEEILGFTAALLYIGTATVIASVTRVADDDAVGTDDRLPPPARGRDQARRGAGRGRGSATRSARSSASAPADTWERPSRPGAAAAVAGVRRAAGIGWPTGEPESQHRVGLRRSRGGPRLGTARSRWPGCSVNRAGRRPSRRRRRGSSPGR